jgi:spindle assembly abnormal protein 6
LETKNGESTLAVIENNEFKKLTHLSLRLRAATDDILKHFLANKLA